MTADQMVKRLKGAIAEYAELTAKQQPQGFEDLCDRIDLLLETAKNEAGQLILNQLHEQCMNCGCHLNE